MKKAIVVLASGNGSTFEAIVEKCEVAEVRLLVTDNPHCYALDRSRKLGVDSHAVYRKDKVELHRRIADVVIHAQPKLVVLAGYMRILPPDFIRHFAPAIVNIHPSLLPFYKGLNTYERVLADGGQVHGTTIHQVTDELDGGPIIAQESVAVLEGDTPETLKERTQAVERGLYPKIIDQILMGKIGLMGAKKP